MIFLLLPLTVLAAALIYQSIGVVRDRRRYPPRGRIVNIDGTQLHVYELGQGSPVVVLESGIGASSLSWAVVQPKLAAFTRVISYDRSGLGWSTPSRVPRSLEALVKELRSLLWQLNEPAPYILVGHSFGGMVVRTYAALHPDDVAGLVLVDPISVAQWATCSKSDLERVRLGVRLAKRGAWAARIGLVRAALAALMAGGRSFPKLAARVGGQRGSNAVANLAAEVRKLPAELWPMVRSHWSDPKSFGALADYLHCVPESARYSAKCAPVRGIPTIILSASTANEHEIEERDRWVSESGLGRQIHVPGTGHWLQLEQPDLVVDAVREVIELAAECGPLKG